MVDYGFKDEQDENAIAFSDIDDWFEKLIEEEAAVDKLEKQGYSYREALSLIKKYGLSNLEGEKDHD